MFLNKKSFICFLTAGILVLTGCQAQNASSQPINPSTSPSNSQYYNENNFEKDARKVTATTLVTYDGPEFLDQYSGVKISVADKDLFVYKTRVIAYFLGMFQILMLLYQYLTLRVKSM